ncbi:hypothetical protein PoB_003518800 [Plakobranchus ocellatus]|uniref:Uncharacterized protein n=1 Tax=Plakobranchus ocellatus TaxID=259542 RepID=A0AAV4AQ47_9GAST|nr:hypothetical protein PoB_003518800 [Plakobranchus ocellatus]
MSVINDGISSVLSEPGMEGSWSGRYRVDVNPALEKILRQDEEGKRYTHETEAGFPRIPPTPLTRKHMCLKPHSKHFAFFNIASPQQDDLRLSDPLSGQDASERARIRNRMVPADLRADSLATVLLMPHSKNPGVGVGQGVVYFY